MTQTRSATTMATRETVYDEVFDAQRHFRTLLDAMARPGRVARFAPLAISPPEGLHKASAYVAMALLNGDATFHTTVGGGAAAAYLRANTHSREVGPESADFLFLEGDVPSHLVELAKAGVAAYPDTGATIVVQVGTVGASSANGGLHLEVEGPGVERTARVCVTGLDGALLAAFVARNVEFPLGLDALLVSADECVVGLPRTSRLRWESL